MKILLVNNRYFVRSGPDRYLFNIKEAMEKSGHTVIPFAFDYNETISNEYQRYFPKPPTGRGPCMFDEQHWTVSKKAMRLARMFFNLEVRRKWRLILSEQKPDIVYSLYLSSSFLPDILKIAKRQFSIPIVYRLSDFHMFCPSYHFFRDGHVCTECLQGLWAAVRHRCIKNSPALSFAKVLQMYYVRLADFYSFVDAFICPSQFMADQLADVGLPKEKLHHLPTYSQDIGVVSHSSNSRYILYLGHVIEEKGVEVLIRAYNLIKKPKWQLWIVGRVAGQYRQRLLAMLDADHRQMVKIDGPQDGERLEETIRSCRFAVHPTLWFENMPNAVLEAMSAGKAVITSNIGSMPEIVIDGQNGVMVKPGDVQELAEAMVRLLGSHDLKTMGMNSRRVYEARYTEQTHITKLFEIFRSLVN